MPLFYAHANGHTHRRALQPGRRAPTLSAGALWRGLERRVARPAADAPRLWPVLAERTDPAQYRPRAIPEVAEEPVREGGQDLVVIHSPRGAYLRLTPAQRDIWRAMDGTRTVAQLATQAFMRHGQLLPVGELTAALRAEGFLSDAPVGFYRRLQGALAGRTAGGLGRRILRALTGITWHAPT